MEKATFFNTRPVLSLRAARLALVFAGASVVLLIALHLLSPEINPAWHVVSEYARGRFAWVLSLMFMARALASLFVFLAVRPYTGTRGGKIGLGLLLVSAAGAGMAAVFAIGHPLHGLATLLDIPTFAIAALLVTAGLARTPDGLPVGNTLRWAAHLPWISLAGFAAALILGLAQTGGQVGTPMLVGWPNRLLALAFSAWQAAVALQVELAEQR